MKKLSGKKVIYFESRHEKTLGDLFRLQGAEAIAAPALKEIPIEENPKIVEFGQRLFRGNIDVLVLLTGVGTRALLSVLGKRYAKEDILDAWRKIQIVPRGPKPIRVLNEIKVPYALTVPEPNTWRELLKSLDECMSVSGKNVAVQEYGISNEALLSALRERGGAVLAVPVYHWALPDDLGPLQRGIEKILSGEIDIAAFTTAAQAHHLFQVAGERAEALRRAMDRMLVASVGPDCSEALREHGLKVSLEPESPKMGPLVSLIAEKA